MDLPTNFKSNPSLRKSNEIKDSSPSNIDNCANHNCSAICSRNQRSKCRNNSPNYSWNRSSNSGYYISLDLIDRGLRFFSDLKQRHYEVLDKNIFYQLTNSLISPNGNHSIGDSLLYYHDMTPQLRRYPDAVLHMKKEEGDEKLDVLMNRYKQKIIEINKITNENGDKILEILENKASESGFNPKTSKVAMTEIMIGVNSAFNQLKNAPDVYEWSYSSEQFMQGVDETIVSCVNFIVKDHEVLQYFDEIKKQLEELIKLMEEIQRKAYSISNAIRDKDYDRDADCCPTYLTILKRFF